MALKSFKSKLFKNFFRSYIILIIITTAVYSIYMLVVTNKLNVSNAENYFQNIMFEEKSAFESKLSEFENVEERVSSSGIFRDLYKRRIVFQDPLDSYWQLKINDELRYLNTSYYVYNIFFVYYGDSYLYSTSGIFDLMEEQKSLASDDTPEFQVTNLKDIFPDVDMITVGIMERDFLIVCKDIVNELNIETGKFFLMVNHQYLRDILSKVPGSEEAMLDVYYGGELLLDYGRVRDYKNGRIFSMKSDVEPAIEYRMFVSGDVFNKKAGSAVNVLYLSITGIIILSVLIAYVLSGSIYKPIRNLIFRINESSPEKEDEKSELQFIEKKVRSLLHDRNDLVIRLDKSRPVLKQSLLHMLLHGKKPDPEFIRMLEANHIELKRKYFCAIVLYVTIDNENNAAADPGAKAHGETLLEAAISAVVQDKALEGYVHEEDVCKKVLLINSNDSELIDDVIQSIYADFGKKAGNTIYSLTIGVGSTYQKLSDVPLSYNEALKALECMISEGRDTIIYYTSAFGKEKQGYYYPIGTDMKMLDALKNIDIDLIEQSLDEIIKENIYKYNLDVYAARCLFYEMLSTVIKNFNELKITNKVNIDYNTVDSLETLYDIHEYFIELYRKACEIVSSEPEEPKNHDENDIIAHIDANCFSEELCLESIAGRFGISVPGVSRLVKLKTGTSYVDYINKKRITKAIEYLRGSDINIQDIYNKVGYNNSLTFRRNFFKYTSMTPNQFREMFGTTRHNTAAVSRKPK